MPALLLALGLRACAYAHDVETQTAAVCGRLRRLLYEAAAGRDRRMSMKVSFASKSRPGFVVVTFGCVVCKARAAWIVDVRVSHQYHCTSMVSITSYRNSTVDDRYFLSRPRVGRPSGSPSPVLTRESCATLIG